MIFGTEEKIMKNTKYQIQYENEIITYELVLSKIKNIYIYIKEGNVIVKAPLRCRNKLVQEFVNKKAKWIYENIKKEKEKAKIEETIELEDIKRLEEIVKSKIERYAILLKEEPNKVRIRDIKYAWGSCSTNRNITINKKLAKKDEKVIEYVVLHEMCHLKHMNHSTKFWDLVEMNMPEYKEYRKILKQ